MIYTINYDKPVWAYLTENSLIGRSLIKFYAGNLMLYYLALDKYLFNN